MQAIHTIKNHYNGINAHLQSYFQAEGGWSEFHNAHIQDIARMLRVQLLPMGYVAGIEKSLQLRRVDDFDVDENIRPASDITIYDSNLLRTVYLPTDAFQADNTSIPIVELLNFIELRSASSIVIYEFDADSRGRGTAIAWLELLLPSNKPGGRDALDYVAKRQKLLQAGLVFTEA